MAPESQIFPFVQLEYAGSAGLPDGRYLAREEGEGGPEQVLIVGTLGAPVPQRRGRRARRSRPDAEPSPLPLTRITAVRADPFPDPGAAASWLERLRGDQRAQAAELKGALLLLNRALAAQRAALGDPYLHELDGERALARRAGFGSGEQLAAGQFSEAIELGREARATRRRDDLRHQERLAAVLGGRERLDVCETLLARARVDLDQGRVREAALQLRVGLEAMLGELGEASSDPGHREDMQELSARRAETAEAAEAALRGALSEGQARSVGELLGLSERVLRRRRVLRG